MLNIMKKRMLLDFRTKSLNKENLLNFILNLLKDKTDFINKRTNLQKLNYNDSWEYNNHKLKKIINEY